MHILALSGHSTANLNKTIYNFNLTLDLDLLVPQPSEVTHFDAGGTAWNSVFLSSFQNYFVCLSEAEL